MPGSQIVVKVLTDTAGFATGMKTASGQADTFKDKVKGLAGEMKALAIGAGIAGGVAFLKGSIDEMREAEKVMRQTRAGIESTGGAANVTAAHVENLAGKLSSMAGVDDELIQTSANLLLTFTNVKNAAGAGNDVFDQATAAALDLSAKGFGSIDSAAKMMGKALNDPIKGIAALGRAGVTFTAQQKEQIKVLTESGDVLGAQKIILGEVQKQVGGAAEAAADPIDKLKVSFGNLQESVGKALLPLLEKLIPPLISAAQWFERNANVLVPLVAALGGLAAVIGTIVAVTKIWTAVQTAFNIVMAANPIVLIIIGIAALIAAIVLLYTKCEWFRNALKAVWDAMAAAFNFVLDIIKGVWNWISEHWPLLLAILTGPIGLAIAFIVQNWDKVKEIFSKVLDWIKQTWSKVFHFLVDPIKNAVDKMVNFGSDLIHGLWDGISKAAGWIKGKIEDLAKKIMGPFAKILRIGSPSKVFEGYGRSIVQGLALGISGNAGMATRAVTDLGRSLNGPNLTGSSSVAAAGGASVASSSPNVVLNLTASGVDPYRLGKVVLDEAAWALRSSGR